MTWGTAIVLLIVAAVCAGIITKMVKDKKSGKHSCSGNCGACAARGNCHK